MLSDLVIINLIISAGSIIVALINKIDNKKRSDELKGDTAKIKEEVSSESKDQPKMREDIESLNAVMTELSYRFTVLSELVAHNISRNDAEFKRLWRHVVRKNNGH